MFHGRDESSSLFNNKQLETANAQRDPQPTQCGQGWGEMQPDDTMAASEKEPGDNGDYI